jgi:hypothetical protein
VVLILYLYEEEQIRILALRGCALAFLDVVVGDVDTLKWDDLV